MLPAKVGSIWPRSFRGEDVLTLANQKQELLLAAMFIGRMEPNEEALYENLHRYFLPSLAPFGHEVSGEKICLTLANQKQELLWWPCFLAEWSQMKKLYRRSYIDASCQVCFNLAKKFQRRRFV